MCKSDEALTRPVAELMPEGPPFDSREDYLNQARSAAHKAWVAAQAGNRLRADLYLNLAIDEIRNACNSVVSVTDKMLKAGNIALKTKGWRPLPIDVLKAVYLSMEAESAGR